MIIGIKVGKIRLILKKLIPIIKMATIIANIKIQSIEIVFRL